MEDMAEQLKGMFAGLARDKKDAQDDRQGSLQTMLVEEEAGKRINEEDLRAIAIRRVEQHGIVFLDEIDKIAARQSPAALTSRARAFSAISCRWWRARPSPPSTA